MAEDVLGAIFSGDDISPPSSAKTSDKVKDITSRSKEESVNVYEQQTNSISMAVTKESEEAGTNVVL